MKKGKSGAPVDLDFDEILEALARPVKLLPRTGDWIAARDARILVADLAKISLDDAEQVLCRRALHWIPLDVSTFGRAEKLHEFAIPLGLGKGKPTLTHFAEVPNNPDWQEVRELFEEVGRHVPILSPGGVHYADWATGDFKVTIQGDYSDITLDFTNLRFDRLALLSALGASSPLQAGTSRMNDDELEEWIENCGTENSRAAWKRLKTEKGAAVPKRDEVFMPAWRKVKGTRPRGRLKRLA